MPPRKKTKNTPQKSSTSLSRMATVLDLPPATLKLDLAAGQNPKAGFEGVDIWPGSKHVVNLMRYPWPWADGSVAELHCSHFAEHIPMIYVDEWGVEVPMGTGGKDALFKFIDECHRVLAPGGWLEIVVPSGKNNRGFQDPTHRRFFVPESFAYFSAMWRKQVSLDHYNATSDFEINVQTTCQGEMNALHPEASARRFHSEWNAAFDYHVRMKKIG